MMDLMLIGVIIGQKMYFLISQSPVVGRTVDACRPI